ncbi:glycosyl transferase family 90-domain-containing protein [Mycena pura]|uniref:Glycosyl transferase family 90-domain-containing protein n=1 Tax=Mycena pura TaxID=153505 RepID=A0AAD6YKL3_9AGAR|nr:glycosyl transferase family 90-domain-containing protein [Mycena pura]
MAPYDPEGSVARPLLALTSSTSPSPGSAYSRRRRRQRIAAIAGGMSLLLVASYAYMGPAAGLPVPESLVPYTYRPSPPFAGNPPPPSIDDHDVHADHPQPGLPPAAEHAPPLDGPDSGGGSDDADGGLVHADDSAAALLAVQPASLRAARARYALKTGRTPPRGFDAFFDFARERQCLVDGYDGVHADFAPFWRAEMKVAASERGGSRGWFRERVEKMAEKLKVDTRGITTLKVSGGSVRLPDTGRGYFDEAWERTISKFVRALPAMTVLINARDEPRVVFDVAPLFNDDPELPPVVAFLADPNPFGLSPPSTAEFFNTRAGCELPPGVGVAHDVPFILSASSAEFTTDFVPVLSMTKLADGASGIAAGGAPGGGHTCFADILIPGEFYYRDSWWAGKFEYPNDIRWADKKDVLYWRGKSNGGHIRGDNFRSFPRFRLMDLAARPEHRAKSLFDVRITEWHEWHCTDNCDAEAIKKEYNITEKKEPSEDAYKYKYLLDVDGNSFSGRYLGLLRSGGLVFKSTAFAEFFTPWLVPYEHFIPVRPDLSDLPAKIEWARANDAEAHRIQESGRVFAERILSDAQNDCYWFAVMLEWGALWGEE